MNEFKFSCPHCDQHILVPAEGYTGVQINCPACQKLIVVPETPGAVKSPSPAAASAALGIQRPAAPLASAPAASASPHPTAYRTSASPPAKKSGSRGLKMALVVSLIVIVCAALGVGGWFGYKKIKAKHDATVAAKGNPATQVAAPTAAEAVQALSILSKVHSAYTNFTSVSADGTITVFLNLSNVTMADVNPNMPKTAAAARNAKRHPQGVPNIITNTTEYSMKRAGTNLYYFAGEAVSKIDRQTMSNTIALWKSDKGQFTFSDSHTRGMSPTYTQIPDANPANRTAGTADQIKNIQHLFDDPANLAKIIKDLGQTDDEPVNGHDCYTLTAKVLGQKVKLWVDKTSYLISQWQITLGGAISDTDIDDAFSLYSAAVTNLPPAMLEGIKAQVKTYTPVMTKIRGTIASTFKSIEINPVLSADDFNYPVPPGVKLTRMPAAATSNLAIARANSQKNACINNLRQIDAAKNQWALENRKKTGDPCTEADIKPYIRLDADGNLPKCPAGGKYTIGKIGENPTCSIDGHVLP